MKILLPFIILMLAFSVSAQVKKPVVKPIAKPTPIVEIKAEVKPSQKVVVEKANGDRLTGLFAGGDADSIIIDLDGNKIIVKLSDISVLRFGDAPPTPTVAETKPAVPSLNVEAAIIYRSGEVVPVARTTFYFLDDDVVTILKSAGVQPTSMTGRTYSDYGKAIMSDIGFSARYGSLPEYQSFSIKLAEAIKSHVKYTFQTDFSGKANLADIPMGKFYLFGIGSTRQSGVVWNLPIDTSIGGSLVLDVNNAAFAY
jgi:hypothetical protein